MIDIHDARELRKIAGRYRVTRGGEDEHIREIKDDMLFGHPEHRQPRIPCEHGAIFIGHGGGLRALTNKPRMVPKLAVMPIVRQTYARFEKDGTCSELTVEFARKDLDAFAKLLGARTRRVCSEAELARLASMGKRFSQPRPEGAFAPGEAENENTSDLSGEERKCVLGQSISS